MKAMRITPSREIVSMPLMMPNVSAIDILFSKTRFLSAETEIIVEMFGSQSGRRLAKWQASERCIKNGWNRFHCPGRREPVDELGSGPINGLA